MGTLSQLKSDISLTYSVWYPYFCLKPCCFTECVLWGTLFGLAVGSIPATIEQKKTGATSCAATPAL